jgi:hypothetical protein
MKLTEYVKGVLQVDKPDSVKSLTLFLSALISAFLGICLGIAIIIDVAKDGVVDMKLDDAGIFMACLGGFMTGSGIPKIMAERRGNRFEMIGNAQNLSDEASNEK